MGNATATASPSPLLRTLVRPHGFEPLRVEGTLPAGLEGTLYRAGPGLFERFGQKVPHAFETDGAVTAVRFDGRGGAEGACRFVESAGYREEGEAGRFLFNSQASWLDRMRAVSKGKGKSAGNTSTFVHQDRLYALMEGGLLQEMDGHTLDTLEASDLGGVVPSAFSAHPHRVASLGTTFNFGVRYGRTMQLDLFALPDHGPARKLGTVEAPWQSMVHDFMATERHLLFVIGPVKLNLLRAMAGAGDITRLFRWTPSLGSRLLVVPLDAIDRPRTFEMDAFWTWHFANGYEASSGPVIDFCRYPSFELESIGEVESSGPPPLLTRLEVDLQAGTTRQGQLFDVPCEFPQVHPRVHGSRHEVMFLQTEQRENGPTLRGVSRLDLGRDRSATWIAPEGHLPSEPVLVPRGEGEDDAYVLDLVYAPETDHSYLAVLDGQRLEDGPLCTVHFDHPLPVTFHGVFAAGALRTAG